MLGDRGEKPVAQRPADTAATQGPADTTAAQHPASVDEVPPPQDGEPAAIVTAAEIEAARTQQANFVPSSGEIRPLPPLEEIGADAVANAVKELPPPPESVQAELPFPSALEQVMRRMKAPEPLLVSPAAVEGDGPFPSNLSLCAPLAPGFDATAPALWRDADTGSWSYSCSLGEGLSQAAATARFEEVAARLRETVPGWEIHRAGGENDALRAEQMAIRPTRDLGLRLSLWSFGPHQNQLELWVENLGVADYSTVQVSPLFSSAARSPWPRLARAARPPGRRACARSSASRPRGTRRSGSGSRGASGWRARRHRPGSRSARRGPRRPSRRDRRRRASATTDGHAVLDADALALSPSAPQTSGSPSSSTQARLGCAVLRSSTSIPLVVVVDGAVLEDLDERRALVRVGAVQHLLQVRGVHVDGARHEGGAGAERERERIDRVVDRRPAASTWSSCRLAEVGEYWPLVRP